MTVRAKILETFDWSALRETPGAIAYCRKNDQGQDVGMVHSCPCGCGILSGVWWPPSTSKVLWSLGGTRESPTLSPSVGIKRQTSEQSVRPDGYHWHGYLENGVWRSV